MTTTQIGYWNYRESKRHNLVTETQGAQQISETHRHNTVTEGQENRRLVLTAQQLAETIRHNKAYEGETQRHNKVSEDVNWYEAKTRRQSQKETVRHNKTTEKVDKSNARTNRQNAQTNARNAATNERNAEINQQNADINQQRADTEYNRVVAVIGETNARTALLKTQDKYYLLNMYVNAKDPIKSLAVVPFMADDFDVAGNAAAIKEYHDYLKERGESVSDKTLSAFTKVKRAAGEKIRKLGKVLVEQWTVFNDMYSKSPVKYR